MNITKWFGNSNKVNKKRTGGLLLSPHRATLLTAARRQGPSVSWLHQCKVGDDQGREGACAIFAMASWAEIVRGSSISDAECLATYHETLALCGLPDDSGLTFDVALQAAIRAGWIAAGTRLQAQGDLDRLTNQPLVAGYSITPNWDNVSKQGCLDHTADTTNVRGYHAVVIVAKGENVGNAVGGPWVFVENSWGLDAGWNGIYLMSNKLHNQLCNEVWALV